MIFIARLCDTWYRYTICVSRLSVRRCVEYNSDGMYQAGAWIMEVWGLDRLKICRRNQSILWPLKCHILSFKTVDGQRCKFHIVKDERLSHKWKVKLIYRGTWNSLMDGPQLTWLTSTSLFYDRSTRLTDDIMSKRSYMSSTFRLCCTWVYLEHYNAIMMMMMIWFGKFRLWAERTVHPGTSGTIQSINAILLSPCHSTTRISICSSSPYFNFS